MLSHFGGHKKGCKFRVYHIWSQQKLNSKIYKVISTGGLIVLNI